MMDSTVQEWEVDYVSYNDLEDWLNEANKDGWVLHTLERANLSELAGQNDADDDFRFVVIMYKPLNAKQRAAEKWAVTVGTTGGHANE